MPTTRKPDRTGFIDGALLLLAFALYWAAEKLGLARPFE